MKMIFLYLSVILASGILFVNIYNSMVDAPSWGSDLPNSLLTARQYYKTVSPGNFFRVFSPLNQVLALVCVLVFWKVCPAARIPLIVAFLLYAGGDLFTFRYFYPRNALLFKGDLAGNIDGIKTAWTEWTTMNWVRSGVVVAGLIFSLVSLQRVALACVSKQ